MGEPECLVPAGDGTGEGAVWHDGEQALYWVDINRFLIHRYDPASRATWSWFFNEPPTTLALTNRADTIAVALGGRIVLWQPRTDSRVDFVLAEDNWPAARLNDGRADPAGNLWVGSMQNNVAEDGSGTPITDRAAGRLFRIGGDGALTMVKAGIGIANTFGWSPDATRFYFADTLTNTIDVYDYDVGAGAIANRRPFFAGFGRGLPDGSAVDSEGHLWNARYGGGCVVRVAPDGTVAGVIEMPCENITTCTFGGPDLRTLYVTTAAGGSGIGGRLAGSLYAVAMDVPGLPENRFRIDEKE
ncbi:MAG: SMP-30/gluconolactonase/LRE family protein [Bauldia sp.]|nr:SMP-30/gluconolactonase/LRE family protein [Bauldia sp.]